MVDNIETGHEKDALLARLENMLLKLPENRRQPIIDLIDKRKVELGLLKSELPVAGYRLKKHPKDTNAVPVPRQPPKRKSMPAKNKEAIRKIAKSIGKITETGGVIPWDIDIKDEPLKKDKKVLEETDSYKY